MAATIDVPATITMNQMRDMLACIGLNHRVNDLLSFVADTEGVHVTLIAEDENGERYINNGRDLATHTVSIKLDRKP